MSSSGNKNENENENEDGYDLFKTGELVLVSMRDGSHKIGEFVFETESGLCLKVGSKTAVKNVSSVTDKKREAAKTSTVKVLKSRNFVQLAKMADVYKIPVSTFDKRFTQKYSESDVFDEEKRKDVYVELLTDVLMKDWEVQYTEPVKYMRELLILIKTFIPWTEIRELASAEETYEEMQLGAFAEQLKNNGAPEETDNVWNQKIEEWKNDGIK